MSDDPCWLPLARATRAVTLVRSGVVLAAFLVLAGCAEPIVLRPPHPEHQAMHRTPSRVRLSATRPERGRTLVQSSPALACPIPTAAPSEELAGPERQSANAAAVSASLSPEQKESLFRDFEDHLRRSGGH
jgi:hypothetical protein